MFHDIFTFVETGVHWVDVTLIIVYLLAMLAFGHFYGGKVHTAKDYFLAGRSLAWWVVGMSIIGSNIGSNTYVGAAGGAYSIGIAQANFEWLGAIPAMILAAFVFIPYYWRAGVYSVPEYLGLRYGPSVRVVSAGILSLFSIFIIGVGLWATALMLQTYLGWPLLVSILATAGVVGVYTISGGLGAVAYTDTIQLTIMFAGAIGLAVMGIAQVGGVQEFTHRLITENPDHLQLFLPRSHERFPWDGVVLGLGLVLSPAFWCANQTILQRCMAARSQWDGQASMVFAAAVKMIVPLLIVLPGFLALLLATGGLDNPDQALPWLIKEVLPPGLSGLLFVAFVAALQSSVDSLLNSTATMVTRDILEIKWPAKDDATMLRRGKHISFYGLALGVLFAPVTAYFEGMYVFMQQVLSFFQGPLFALVLLGIVTKRATYAGGLTALVTGVLLAGVLSAAGVGMLYVAFWSFVYAVGTILVMSAFSVRRTDAQLANLTVYTTTAQATTAQATTAQEP